VPFLVRMANLAEPLMIDGGVLATMSYYGADEVIANYSLIGPVKAALEAAVRYLACELGPKGDPRPCRLVGSAQNTGGFRRCPLR
jgi:enoyl-[acyl-carrier-protein] reductase (NADH)